MFWLRNKKINFQSGGLHLCYFQNLYLLLIIFCYRRIKQAFYLSIQVGLFISKLNLGEKKLNNNYNNANCYMYQGY